MIQKILDTVLSRHFILYGVIGGTGAALDLIFYIVLCEIGVNPALASFLSVTLGIVNNFLLNAQFNFKKRDHLLTRFVNFYFIGLGGAILSVLLIVILHNGIGVTALTAKLLTIIPVVLLQFVLNKKFSFSSLKSMPITKSRITNFLRSHWTIIITTSFFCFFAFIIIMKLPALPPNGGPDEYVHFNNVQFIIDNKRLPVSGQDDTAILSTCVNHPFNYVPCLYSYQSYPGANYVISAVGGWFINQLTDIDTLKGTRIVSLIWGIMFTIIIFLTVRRFGLRNIQASIVTASIALIPQVIFIFSYVNQDAHSLFIAALLVYSLVRLYQKPDKKAQIIVGLAVGGLLPLAKYTYFSLFAIVVGVIIIGYIKKIIDLAIIKRLILWIVVWFMVLASFWYIRNIILYNDLLGHTFMINEMLKYHPPGLTHSLFSLKTFEDILALGFFNQLFQSFFITLGYMNIFAPNYVYMIILASLITGLVLLTRASLYSSKTRRRNMLYGISSIIIFMVILIIASYINSVKFDYQAQGRYLFSSLPLLAAFMGYAYSDNNKTKPVLVLQVITTVFLLTVFLIIIVRSYL